MAAVIGGVRSQSDGPGRQRPDLQSSARHQPVSASVEFPVVRIRMQRFGRTHRPFYRINAVDARVKRDGKVIEALGWYDPIARDPGKQVELKGERIKDWLSRGAQPSETVLDLLGRHELLDGKMKAEWEAQRALGMNRGRCQVAMKAIEAAITELTALAKSGNAEAITPHLNHAKRALNDVKRTISGGDVAQAESLAKAVAAAADQAKSADASAKAAAEAAKAAAEAAKAAEAPSA